MNHRLGLCTVIAALIVSGAHSRAQDDVRSRHLAVQDVRLGFTETEDRHTLLLRDGRIVAILAAEEPIPAGTRVIDGEGRLAVPAFIDAFATALVTTPEPALEQDVPVSTSSDVRVDMRAANRKGIQPGFRASAGLLVDLDNGEDWRSSGFSTALAAPSGEMLAGVSCAISTRMAASRDRVVIPEVFAHASFNASGSGYPSTLMGYHSQLRQFFWDARRHGELQRREADGGLGARPAFDLDLEAGLELLAGERRMQCEAQSARDIERWLRLADELGLEVGISGGRDAWKAAASLAEREIAVVLTLEWEEEVPDPDEAKDEEEGRSKEEAKSEQEGERPGRGRRGGRRPMDGAGPGRPREADAEDDSGSEQEAAPEYEYDEPVGVKRERRRLWLEQRDNTLRLHEAGIPLVFGTGGQKPAVLLKRVRKLVEAGLPANVALAALTAGAAEHLGVEGRMGRIAVGYDASFALWTSDPMEKSAQLAWLFVDGEPHEYEVKEGEDLDDGAGPGEGIDVSGRWQLSIDSPVDGESAEATLELRMTETGEVDGELDMRAPIGGGELNAEVSGVVSGASLSAEAELEMEGMVIEVRLKVEIDGDSLQGEAIWVAPFGEESSEVSGKRSPGAVEHGSRQGRGARGPQAEGEMAGGQS